MSRKQEEYAKALDLLDQMRANGQVTENEFALRRTRLLAEASKPPRQWSIKFLIFAGVVAGIYFVMLILVRLVA